jgi:hypothetical protein
MIETVRTPRLEVLRRERTQVRAHEAQHLFILRCQLLEPGTDRHPGRAGRDERFGDLPQSAHLVTPLHPDDLVTASNEAHP